MKLLTLNAHSLADEAYPMQLEEFVRAVAAERPDIIALQEANQTASAPEAEQSVPNGYVACAPHIVLKRDNHVLHVAARLHKEGLPYAWTWLPVKLGYGKYDEGVALLSLRPITAASARTVSHTEDYRSWKTRKILGISVEDAPGVWFFSVHFGWWTDAEDPFAAQWARAEAQLPSAGQVWLLGDFNNPAQRRGEGYDLLARAGWHDSYVLAAEKDNGNTVEAPIDGWTDRGAAADGLRIDQIWCRQRTAVKRSRVIFDGKFYPVVSDHYGVLVEIERGMG